MSGFGRRLKAKREEKKFSYRDLEERSGIGKGNIWRYERGQSIPNADSLFWLAKSLDTTMDYLWVGGSAND